MNNVASLSVASQRKAALELLNKKAVALGNTDLTPEHIVADLVNQYVSQYGRKGFSKIADGSFLGTQTVERVGKDGGSEGYNPQGQTTWRLLRFFGRKITIEPVRITPKYQNKPKIV